MKQGTVDTKDLSKEQLRFTVNVLATILNDLVQDDLETNVYDELLPINKQKDIIKKAMIILQYK